MLPDAKNQLANPASKHAATKKRKRNRRRTLKRKQDRMALAAEKESRKADDEFKKKIDSTIIRNVEQDSVFPDITVYHNKFPDLFDANIRCSSPKFAPDVKEARRSPVHSHHKENEQ